MPLTSNQAFKAGMLLRMAQEGLTREQMLERVDELSEKLGSLQKQAGLGQNVWDTAKSLGFWGGATAIAAPVVGGAFVGHSLNKALDADATDVEEARKRELIFEYQRMADEANRQNQVKRDLAVSAAPKRHRALY